MAQQGSYINNSQVEARMVLGVEFYVGSPAKQARYRGNGDTAALLEALGIAITRVNEGVRKFVNRRDVLGIVGLDGSDGRE